MHVLSKVVAILAVGLLTSVTAAPVEARNAAAEAKPPPRPKPFPIDTKYDGGSMRARDIANPPKIPIGGFNPKLNPGDFKFPVGGVGQNS